MTLLQHTSHEWTLMGLLSPSVGLWLVGVVSFVLAVTLVLTRGWHGWLSNDASRGVQRLHLTPVPRIGGVALFISLAVTEGMDGFTNGVSGLLTPLLAVGGVVFAIGLLEDLTQRVPVWLRLLVTLLAGVLMTQVTGVSLERVGLPLLDKWLQNLPWLSVLFTAIAVAGVSNATNIIDGLNGLASTVAMVVLSAFGVLALHYGDVVLARTCAVLVLSVLGFWLLNWPFGRLFLGDGGAYFMGFAMAWMAVLLVERHPQLNPFAPLLMCLYPVLETLFSVFRRRIRRCSPGMPDRQHFHTLAFRRYARRWLSFAPPWLVNSCTGVSVALLMTLPNLFWVWWWHDHELALWFGCVLAVWTYVALYARMVRHHWCSPLSFLWVRHGRPPVTVVA